MSDSPRESWTGNGATPPPERLGEFAAFLCWADTRNGASIVRVHGEVDMATAPVFKRAVEAPGPQIVDLTQCRYLDSSGLAVLIAKQQAVGERVSVVVPQGSFLRRLFKIAGIGSLVTMFETIDDATAASETSSGRNKLTR